MDAQPWWVDAAVWAREGKFSCEREEKAADARLIDGNKGFSEAFHEEHHHLLLALSLLLGACALADDRADMPVAAAVNELGYSATKGG